MEAKKSKALDLEHKRSVFFQIGLLTVGSLTLAAFNYKAPLSYHVEKSRVQSFEITFTQEAKEEVAKPVSLVHKQQKEEVHTKTGIDLNANPDEHTKQTGNTGNLPDPKVGLDALGFPFIGNVVITIDSLLYDEVYEDADQPARYVGGYPEMSNFIGAHLVYPDISRQFGEQGTVYVSFVVEKDGRVTNVAIERGVSEDLDQEAKRVVRAFPNWIPGEYQFQKVRTRVRLPIVFELAP